MPDRSQIWKNGQILEKMLENCHLVANQFHFLSKLFKLLQSMLSIQNKRCIYSVMKACKLLKN